MKISVYLCICEYLWTQDVGMNFNNYIGSFGLISYGQTFKCFSEFFGFTSLSSYGLNFSNGCHDKVIFN